MTNWLLQQGPSDLHRLNSTIAWSLQGGGQLIAGKQGKGEGATACWCVSGHSQPAFNVRCGCNCNPQEPQPGLNEVQCFIRIGAKQPSEPSWQQPTRKETSNGSFRNDSM